MTIHEKELNKICNYVAMFFILFTLVFYLLSIIKRGPLEKDVIKDYAFVLGILCTGIFVFLIIAISSELKTDRGAMIALFGFSLVILLIWNHFIKAVPISDYRILWEGANQIVEGTFYSRSIKKDDYFCFYNYQIAYTFYLSLLIRVFHGSLPAIRVVETIIMSLTNVVLYKTLRLFTSRRASFCGAALFMGWPFLFMGSGILNNQHEAMLFEALAVHLFLKYNGEKKIAPCKWILCATFLSVAESMRPTAFVIVIAIIALCIFKCFLKKNIQYIIVGGIVLASYLAISNTINAFFIMSGLAPYGIKSSSLWFKLSLGLTGTGITLQRTTDAAHTNLYYDLQYYGFNYDAYKEAAAAYIKRIIKTGSINYENVLNRVVYFAGAIDNQYGFIGTKLNLSHHMIVSILNVMGICIYFVSVAFAGIRCIFKRIIDMDEISLPALVFFGYFIVYILFETQTRYRYEQYYMLFLMAVPSMATVWCILKQNIGKVAKVID